MTQIEDGTGTSYLARVDSNNRMQTSAVTQTELHDAVHRGKTWNIGTGFLTLTSTSPSTLIYLKNTSDDNLFIDLYILLTRASTGGSGDMLVEILRNPTGGSIVNAGTAIPSSQISNMDFSSANEPDATINFGGEGFTATGESAIMRSLSTASNRLILGILTLIPSGSSVAIRATPPTGNTSMDVETAIEIYEDIA